MHAHPSPPPGPVVAGLVAPPESLESEEEEDDDEDDVVGPDREDVRARALGVTSAWTSSARSLPRPVA